MYPWTGIEINKREQSLNISIYLFGYMLIAGFQHKKQDPSRNFDWEWWMPKWMNRRTPVPLELQ